MHYCTKEKIPVLAVLPNDRRIAELYSRGKLIYPELPAVEGQLNAVWDFINKAL
jgi:hypothetical protein